MCVCVCAQRYVHTAPDWIRFCASLNAKHAKSLVTKVSDLGLKPLPEQKKTLSELETFFVTGLPQQWHSPTSPRKVP